MVGEGGGEEHLSTIEMEEEYVQSLVTGTLHRANTTANTVALCVAQHTYIIQSECCIQNTFRAVVDC